MRIDKIYIGVVGDRQVVQLSTSGGQPPSRIDGYVQLFGTDSSGNVLQIPGPTTGILF